MNERYEDLRERHDREWTEWLTELTRKYPSLTAAAREECVNVGTLWRMCKRRGVKFDDNVQS